MHCFEFFTLELTIKHARFFNAIYCFHFFRHTLLKLFCPILQSFFLTLTNNYATYFFNSETLFSFQRG